MSYSVKCTRGYGKITFTQNGNCPVSGTECCEIDSCNMESLGWKWKIRRMLAWKNKDNK